MRRHSVIFISILLIFLFCMFLPACRSKNSDHAAALAGEKKIRIDFEDFNNGKNNLNYLAFRENDSVIYVYAENGNITCYRYYFNDGRNIQIGELQNYNSYSNAVADLDEDVCFTVMKGQEDQGVKKELVCISLSDNTLKVLPEYDDDRISSHQEEQEDVSYVRRSNILLLWDPDQKEYREVSLELDKGESIHVVMKDGESLFLSCYVQDGKGNPLGKHVYVIPDYMNYLSEP